MTSRIAITTVRPDTCSWSHSAMSESHAVAGPSVITWPSSTPKGTATRRIATANSVSRSS